MVTKDFVIGGRAIFTVANANGTHYTYKVRRKDADLFRTGDIYFVSLLTGPDNTRDYTYLGVLEPNAWTFRLTAKSRLTASSQPVQVLQWALGRISKGTIPAGYTIQHEGRCGRCGRLLTVPESITSGFGPECRGYRGR